jgi:hypothetical protein
MSCKSTIVYATLTAFTMSTLLSSTASAAHFGGGGGSGFRPSVTRFHQPMASFRPPTAGIKKIERRGNGNAGNALGRTWPGQKTPPWGNTCEACPPRHNGPTSLIARPLAPGPNFPSSPGVPVSGPTWPVRGGNLPSWRTTKTSTNGQTRSLPGCNVCDPSLGVKIWESVVGLGVAVAGVTASIAGGVAVGASATAGAAAAGGAAAAAPPTSAVVAVGVGSFGAGLGLALAAEQAYQNLKNTNNPTEPNGANDTGGTLPDGGAGSGGSSTGPSTSSQADEAAATTIEVDENNNWIEKDKDGHVVNQGGPTPGSGGGSSGGASAGAPLTVEAAKDESGGGGNNNAASPATTGDAGTQDTKSASDTTEQ